MYSTHIHNEFTYLLALEESPLFSLSNKSLRAIYSTMADANNVRFQQESQIRPSDFGVNCYFLSSSV